MQVGKQGGRIFYFCFDSDVPTGGIKKIYQHVDILNELGLTAFVLHKNAGFRCTWFQNATKIAYGDLGGNLSMDDIIVFPEVMDRRIISHVSKQGFRFVIFNQNAYYTFLNNPYLKFPSIYKDKNLLGVIVVSEDNKRYLQYVFPDANLYRIHISIDFGLFSYQKEKKRQIAFMPRKAASDSEQIICILHERGVLKDWSLIPIHEMPEQKVAQILKESALFLSFSQSEGLGLPPIEAVACGCIVIGYHGFGGREYFHGPTIFPIGQGDIIEYARTVEKVLIEYDNRELEYRELTHQAKKKIQKEYSREREKENLSHTWGCFQALCRG